MDAKRGKSGGVCWIAGAGPGDLGLLTLRARECVGLADVIYYDHLCNPEILAWARPDAERVCVGKRRGECTLKQEEINALLVKKTREGNRVLRLKGGDPFLFGRGAEEAAALAAAGLSFEIVPGVTSAIAAPAAAGIPVTHRDFASQLTIFTGHVNPEKPACTLDYKHLATASGTKVLLMGMHRIREIAGELLDHGMTPETPVALVRWGTTGRQQTVTGRLDTIADLAERGGFCSPAVAVFGDVVGQRASLNWFESRPLFGKRIVVTRTRKQAGALSAALRGLGAEVMEIPTIRTGPPADLKAFYELVMQAHTYGWLVFSSPNGVDAFFEAFFKLYKDLREIGGARIAAIGEATAERLREHRLSVDLVPEKAVAESLVAAFRKQGSVENETILVIRPEVTRDVVAPALTKLGAIVDEAVAYQTVPETEDAGGAQQRFREEGADMVTFTSSSTAENFLKLGLPLPAGLKIASIGPATSQTVRDHGMTVDVEATRHDIPGLVEAVRRFFEKAG